MTVDTRLPASTAGAAKTQTFGSASLRLLPPQYVFEIVRSQAAQPRGEAIDVRWPAPAAPGPRAAANQNEQPHYSNAA